MNPVVESRPRVVMTAYACSPEHGSEPGVGWGWATQAARWCDVWVICEADRYGAIIQRHLDRVGPIPHLHFAYVARSRLARLVGAVPGCRYSAYNLWHRAAFREAQRLHREIGFDLAHQVTFCGYREPGYLADLGVPFVWGPVGGTQNYPWMFLGRAGWRGGLSEGTRSLLNSLQLHLAPRIRRAARRARVLLAANTTVQHDLREALGVAPELLLETGVRSIVSAPPLRTQGPLRILWSGDLSPWKALPLLLEALARMPGDLPFEVRILGRGRCEGQWRRLADRLGVADRVHWLGWIPYAEALRQYAEVDLLAFTSLRDTSGNVVLEALANGLPVVCLDHQGVRDIVTPECGIKVPVTTPEQTILGLRDALTTLGRDPERRRQLGEGALTRARYYHWDAQGERMAEVYRRVLEPKRDPVSPRPAATLREHAADLVKRAAGLTAACLHTLAGASRNVVGILVYHRIARRVLGVPTPTMNVTPEAFRRQLEELRGRGYEFWPLRRLLGCAAAKQPIPGRVAVVTFDDGFANVHADALPILRELNIPATVFLNTAYLGSAEPFPFDSWAVAHQAHLPEASYRPLGLEQCRLLAAEGLVELGAHTHTHADFRGKPETFREDLARNLQALHESFGLADATFAFPFGRVAQGYASADLVAAARSVGVLCALTTEATPVDIASDPFAWGRFNCYEWDNGATLAAKLEGWYGWAPRLQEWLARRRANRG